MWEVAMVVRVEARESKEVEVYTISEGVWSTYYQ